MKLSRTERDFVKFFLRHRGKPLTRTEIVSAVWHEEYLGLTNIVDVNVSVVRKKMGRDVIRTVRGIGYMMPKPDQPCDQI